MTAKKFVVFLSVLILLVLNKNIVLAVEDGPEFDKTTPEMENSVIGTWSAGSCIQAEFGMIFILPAIENLTDSMTTIHLPRWAKSVQDDGMGNEHCGLRNGHQSLELTWESSKEDNQIIIQGHMTLQFAGFMNAPVIEDGIGLEEEVVPTYGINRIYGTFKIFENKDVMNDGNGIFPSGKNYSLPNNEKVTISVDTGLPPITFTLYETPLGYFFECQECEKYEDCQDTIKLNTRLILDDNNTVADVPLQDTTVHVIRPTFSAFQHVCVDGTYGNIYGNVPQRMGFPFENKDCINELEHKI